MIGKHIKGREFSRALRYVMTKPGAQLLGGTLTSLTPEDANLEFQSVAQESTRIQKPLLHCALSLAPGESLSNHQWRILVDDYLQALGYRQNQYLLVRHTDTPSHEHVHLIVNRVAQNGKVVSDSWDYMHSQAVLHRLETEYGLSHARLSWEKQELNLPSNGDAVSRTIPHLAHPFEPDDPLPTAHQRYLQLEAWVRQQAGSPITQRQVDLQIAQWALRSTRPEEARVLVYSPEIRWLRLQQGDTVALDHLRALIAEVQRRETREATDAGVKRSPSISLSSAMGSLSL